MQRPKWHMGTEQRDEIGVAVQIFLWEQVELIGLRTQPFRASE